MSRACLKKAERKVLHLLHGHRTRRHLREIHGYFLRHGLHCSNQVLSHFVSVCGYLDKMEHARRLFFHTHNPNILLYNSIIKGFSLNLPFEESLRFFSLMKSTGIRPDEFTFAPLLKACSSLEDIRIGESVHGEVVRVGFERFRSIRIGVIELYTTCGSIECAEKLFDEMPHRDSIVWNLMISGFCKEGEVDIGLRFFRRMNEPNVVSWNSIISSLAKSQRHGEALALFHEMQDHGLEPDEATVVIVLPICAHLNAVKVGERIHSYAKLSNLFDHVVSVGNSLVDFYSKCGNFEDAKRVFKTMPRKNVVSWNSIISGMAFNGEDKFGVDLFEEMIRDGDSKPNGSTFVGVLSCCSHAGLVEKGQELFLSMSEDHGLNPNLEHYGCMVDLLGRSGFVMKAYELIRKMPEDPNSAVWGSLLSSCRTHGKPDLAEIAVKELIHLEPWNSGNYVLLANIRAGSGRWEEVEKIRELMKGRSVKKVVGRSSLGRLE